ncbi:2-oxoglutarate and iron-dependent oxygenase domain-containing protein 3-like [Rhodnius prolixus]
MAENTDLKSRKHKEKGLEGLLEGEKTSKEDESSKESTSGKGSTEEKFGPMPSFPRQRFWTRMVLILGTLVIVYITSGKERIVNFAKSKEIVNGRMQDIKCSKEYFEEVYDFPGCVPVKCGRFVSDILITNEEADLLLDIAKRGLAHGGSDGGASILDLHTGALSKGKNFVSLYQVNPNVFSSQDFAVYVRVRKKVQKAVALSFDIKPEKLFLTKPSFFSRLTANDPATPHDEYWHSHVDKETYPSFHYTSLVYLNDYESEFTGGRFIFDDPDNVSTVIEPKKGRVSIFSSGKENLHHVERVKSGTRFAITVSFTCNKKFAISDPFL